MKEFKISEKEGLAYSLESGDKNKIHLDDLTGYNSIFNHKIIYGTLIFYKVLKHLNFKKLKRYSVKIQFLKGFKYNLPIKLKKKKIFQKNFGLAHIRFIRKTEYDFENKNLKLIKTFKVKNCKSNTEDAYLYKKRIILNYLSWYVGMIRPGKNSLISSINFGYNSNNKKYRNLKIYSSKKTGYPIIHNRIKFDKFIVEFLTTIRPHLKKTNTKISQQVKSYALNTKIPVLILGSSTGIGKEVFNIFKINQKINIIATYNKNKLISNKKNIQILKLNIKDIEKNIKNIFNKYQNLRIYYFLSPKILIGTNNNYYKIKEYKNFYIKTPKKIISLVPKNLNLEFFYPSTIFIDQKTNDDYTKSKIFAEKILTKLNKNNIKISILRIERINTKQNLSILYKKNQSFTDKLNNNKHYREKVFFLK